MVGRGEGGVGRKIPRHRTASMKHKGPATSAYPTGAGLSCFALNLEFALVEIVWRDRQGDEGDGAQRHQVDANGPRATVAFQQ